MHSYLILFLLSKKMRQHDSTKDNLSSVILVEFSIFDRSREGENPRILSLFCFHNEKDMCGGCSKLYFGLLVFIPYIFMLIKLQLYSYVCQ